MADTPTPPPPAHTPGPWRAFTHSPTGTFAVLRERDDKPVVQWTGFAASPSTQRQRRADAVLCAAAPDLLAALQRIVSWDSAGMVLTEDHISQAVHAIAKATGRKTRAGATARHAATIVGDKSNG